MERHIGLFKIQHLGNKVVLYFIMAISFACSQVEMHNTPLDVLYQFTKSLTTRDSSLLYSCIDAHLVSESLNSDYKFDRKIGDKDIHYILFLKYAPWKITEDKLEQMRNDIFVFETFQIRILSKEDKAITAQLDWRREKNAEMSVLKVFLYLDEKRNWRIKKLELSSWP